MQKRWPEYKKHCRRPYPEMAYRAMGTKVKHFVSFCLCLTQYGIVTVLTLLASNNLSNLLTAIFGIQINFCYVILMMGIVVWPFIMIKSPMDFWQAAVGAAASSTVAAILIVVGSLHDAPACNPVVTYPEFSFKNLFLGYGTIAFAYGGHGAFPTIQHDMTKPFRFNRSVWASYIYILIFYLIVAVTGYEVYGNSMKNTIIPSLQITWLSQLVNLMITVHVLPTIVIVFSPLAQQVEEWTGVPSRHFGVRRFIIRSLLLLGCIFTAESIPHFGVFLDLVGGSTITLMTMLLPSVFYLFLFASEKKRLHLINTMQVSPDSPDDQLASITDILRYTSKPVLFFNLASFGETFGLIGGVAASTAAIAELLDAKMAPPCYITWFTSGLNMAPTPSGSVHCCGPFRNITVNDIDPLSFCLLGSYG
ncbi:transmembrane amino acid transporter protein [Oesophagostomum dentatum]|uniref:Transmembrane amino acid transporter protein n=1 Tax=Oesophagostomum dentatum TaxID=61180 RepID=A0A0B1STG8_OESDE|nr:transmembrane amino acid transporter protein [Oesophagostomum dentatum]